MKPHHLVMLATVLAVAGCTTANTHPESASVYRQGSSTATISQDGGGSPTTRRVIRRGPNSQTIIQQQGGNSAVITQN